MKLRAAMEGFTDQQVAEALPGVNPGLVGHWRSGTKTPGGVYACWLLQTLGVEPVDLVPLPRGLKPLRPREREPAPPKGELAELRDRIALLEERLLSPTSEASGQ